MNLGFLLSHVAALDATWSSVHLVKAALDQGHRPTAGALGHEVLPTGRLMARAWLLDGPVGDCDALAACLRTGSLPRRFIDVAALDLLLLRVNPFSPDALQFALLAQRCGVTVINDQLRVSRTRTKGWLATLTDVPRPDTLVTASRASVEAFIAGRGADTLIVKPAAGSGGRGVSLVPPGRRDLLEVAVSRALDQGGGHVVIQQYLPEADLGEKRLVWVDGEIIGGYLRQRADGEFRHNLKRGGHPHPVVIDDADRRLCQALSPHLARNGIRLAGLDVIGGRLIEVNTLNPGGLHWSDALGHRSGWIAQRAMHALTGPPGQPLSSPKTEAIPA